MKPISLAAAAAVAAALAACATTPRTSADIEQAQQAVQMLQAQPDASTVAARPLNEAQTALASAQRAWDARQREDATAFAYVARRNAEAGEAMVAEARARAAMAQAQHERDTLVADARERQLAAAQAATREAQERAAQAEANAQAQAQAASAAQQSAAQAAAAQQQAHQQLAALQGELNDLHAKQTERGMVMTLGSVLFDTGAATLKPGADRVLDQLAEVMQENSKLSIIVEGHTDSRGSTQLNDQLSQHRAQAVADALASRGISADRVRAEGMGSEYPVASNRTTAGRQLNRRVEVIFSDTEGHFAPQREASAAPSGGAQR
jgi:outer membrane protein OmpA-like peptidoglycan-associated protein